ncbi:ABC transporter substrate-binding protein [Niveibacterium microcysteis]|uniref:ABC transporter substrate-binding protein n=1 Tax=Niveibacterium microcysteis TaxID=2811415 RepID=A0ABX7M5I3_9RHOO|nr:ABC transporter substrate-binding protein [Niveibacterium microcysteis]QSI76691.1 ABC transporter substrate-binding protein [Niveibacterium microcysteis]
MFMLRLATAALAAALTLPALAAKTLVYCSEGSPEGFNSQFFTTNTTHDAASAQLMNRLVEFEVGTTNIVPGLATSWEISPDGLAYTFHLRRGVKFHTTPKFKPTRDFNADDVMYSWYRMADPNHPFHKNSPGQTYAYFEDMGMARIVEKLEKLDDYTVRFKLRQPEAPFLANMAMDFMSILSAEHAEKMKAAGSPELIDREPVGTGPFQLVSYQKDAVIRYKAHEQYWDGRPAIDNLIFAITPDASVRYAKIKAGECQLMAFPKPADLAQMKADPALNLMSKEGLNIGYIAFNVEKKPFDDKRVRQALNMAINKKAILDTIYQGAGQMAKNPIPPIMWGYNDRVKDYDYSPDKAKALLAQAGLKDGFEMELWYLPVQRPYNPDGKRMGELIQADLAKVGVRVKLITYEWGEYRKRSKAGEHQAIMFGWSGDNGDPDNFFTPLLSCDAVKGGGNNAKWCNKEFDDLIAKATRTADRKERAKLYEKAQEIVKDEAPWVPIAHSVRFEPVRKEVKNYKMAAVPVSHFLSKVDLAK